VEWNGTKKEYCIDKRVHQLFEEQVVRSPKATAVIGPSIGPRRHSGTRSLKSAEEREYEELTYGELNAKANQLAHYLRKRGIGPESLVGICVERSLEMIIGMLGVLKAGGAYVPLDPNYPAERLAFVLDDSKVGLVLTQAVLADAFPRHRAMVVCLDSEWNWICHESGKNPAVELAAENLAYVIYTSGSTGTPKGVAVAHRSLAN
jgi:non-ribosomal peptide synthetase component F